MQDLFTNRSTRHDFVRNPFMTYGHNCEVKIASAFFSDSNLLRELVNNRCSVRLIVRLGAGTSPVALREAEQMAEVQIRYFSDDSFHPKFYIFGQSYALLGSANLTKSGMGMNCEAAIGLTSEDPRFDELELFFIEMWDQARVVNREVVTRYERDVYHPQATTGTDNDIRKIFGNHGFGNIVRSSQHTTKNDDFVEDYKRAFQAFLKQFAEVSSLYESLGTRLDDRVPLRIEIDQFLNYIREELTKGDSYLNEPELPQDARQTKILDTFRQFQAADPAYLHVIARERYPSIMRVLGSESSLEGANPNELYEALLIVHAFSARQRYFEGGVAGMKDRFFTDNPEVQIKRSLKHLLFGRPKYEQRMADCIFDPSYKMSNFGRSCVQETFGWVNNEDVPICNERTLKSLRWLGFNIRH